MATAKTAKTAKTAAADVAATAKPKRAPTAFNLFVKDKIAELRAAEPGQVQKEYMSQAAAAWNEYKAANGMPASKPKAPKDPNAPKRLRKNSKAARAALAAKTGEIVLVKPKRAPTAYNLFIKEKMTELRAAEPGLKSKEYMTKAAALYRESKPAPAVALALTPVDEVESDSDVTEVVEAEESDVEESDA